VVDGEIILDPEHTGAELITVLKTVTHKPRYQLQDEVVRVFNANLI